MESINDAQAKRRKKELRRDEKNLLYYADLFRINREKPNPRQDALTRKAFGMTEQPHWSNGTVDLYAGDARRLSMIHGESVQCIVTSPPYWGLRNYGLDDGIGLEPTLDEHVQNLVAVGRELRRVLRDDGTLWLNLGDAYAGSGKGRNADGSAAADPNSKQATHAGYMNGILRPSDHDLPAKNLLGIPWRVAFALQDDGWILRSAIVWHKPNPMPESVRDRPTGSYEMVFLLTKQKKYFYDSDAIRTTAMHPTNAASPSPDRNDHGPAKPSSEREFANPLGANARNVWKIATQPRKDAHFATFPDELARRCILAGSATGDTVLDPFVGSGTTAVIAQELGRHAIGVDLNGDYLDIAQRRVESSALKMDRTTA